MIEEKLNFFLVCGRGQSRLGSDLPLNECLYLVASEIPARFSNSHVYFKPKFLNDFLCHSLTVPYTRELNVACLMFYKREMIGVQSVPVFNMCLITAIAR